MYTLMYIASNRLPVIHSFLLDNDEKSYTQSPCIISIILHYHPKKFGKNTLDINATIQSLDNRG